jgi:hypothetical protein
MMKIVQTVTELFNLIQSDPLTAIITLLILFFSTILLYKKFGVLQIVYNWIINNILRFMKRDYVMLTTFSKKEATNSKIKGKYQEQGCLFLTLNVIKLFEVDGSIKKENLLKILKKQRKRMKVAVKRGKNTNSLIYLGFPHVPLTFLDGYYFKDTDDPILFEYQGEDTETLGKGFYELNKKYNTDMKIISNYYEQNSYGNEVAIKIEQSFPILDEGITSVSNVSHVISIGIENPDRWKINNYAQIDLYQKFFLDILSKLKAKGVSKIHLFATTPVSLSFSLGRVINHYHPEIIVYNYNNNAYDWAINLKTEDIIIFE